MDLYKLKSFYTVAKMGSFSRAAEALYLTQPAVSTQIKDLESEYKTKLFDRIGRNIRLTQSGEMLIPYVKNILDLVDESHLAVNVLKKAGEGSVKVGVSELPGARLIPDCLSRFLEQYPKVSISVTAKKSALITDLVKTNKVDLGIVGNSLPEISENDFKGETVHKDNIVVAVSNSHPLAQKKSVTVKELSNLPLIVSLKNTVSRQAIDKLFHRLNIPYKIAYEIDNKSMIKTMIEKNLGIAFFSYLEIKKEAESGWIKTLSISDYPFYRYIQIIYHKNKKLSPSQKAFYDFFVEEKDCPDGQPL